VFRDENLDEDLQKSLKWGTPAQKTLSSRIREQCALLLVDTPDAVKSPWVRIEVEEAHALLKPIFPVVMHQSNVDYKDVGIGGRFRINRDCQVGISCPYTDLSEDGVGKAISEAFLDELVAQLGKYLTRHLYVLRYLIRSTEEQFKRLDFLFDEVEEDRLHVAWASRNDASTPGLRVRFLVKCSPYRSLSAVDIKGMKLLMRSNPDYCQYGLLVEPPSHLGFVSSREELLSDQGGHIMILHADEIREVAKRLIALGSQI
jgi:hypothetical protein